MYERKISSKRVFRLRIFNRWCRGVNESLDVCWGETGVGADITARRQFELLIAMTNIRRSSRTRRIGESTWKEIQELDRNVSSRSTN
jgi:hypothetical protein